MLGASNWSEGSGSRETVDFVSGKLRQLLQGKENDPSTPPHIDVHCSDVSKVNQIYKRLVRKTQSILHRLLDEGQSKIQPLYKVVGGSLYHEQSLKSIPTSHLPLIHLFFPSIIPLRLI